MRLFLQARLATHYVINCDKIGENFKSIHQMTEIKYDYLFLIDFTI